MNCRVEPSPGSGERWCGSGDVWSGDVRTRTGLLVLLVAAGSLLLALPVGASNAPPVPGSAVANEPEALALLDAAARAARSRSWSGTQYVSTWRAGRAGSAVLEVRHEPGHGTQVRLAPSVGAAATSLSVPPTKLDERLLRLLADRYELVVAGRATCSGRLAQVVEARRPDGRVAGRFWLDSDSGLALRREVYDAAGSPMSSSAFVDVSVRGVAAPASALPLRLVGLASPTPDLAAVGSSGWRVPGELPGGYVLFEARRPAREGGQVLHLAYSDGLSTLSLFSQPGGMTGEPRAGYTARSVGDARVLVADDTPERMVWSGGGQVFTLVSGAAHEDLLAVVGALPHDRSAATGVRGRLGRGLARVGSWVNPFS